MPYYSAYSSIYLFVCITSVSLIFTVTFLVADIEINDIKLINITILANIAKYAYVFPWCCRKRDNPEKRNHMVKIKVDIKVMKIVSKP